MIKDFCCENWRDFLPIPVYKNRPEYIKLYNAAWELAHEHIRIKENMPSPIYMDEAFCETQVWIWDSCFMSLFCKYAAKVFPGVETLDNFYSVLYDGKTLGKVIPPENEPEWTGATSGKPFEMQIHIADNPPLFAWAEYQNALFSGDKERIKRLLYKDEYLQKHYEWLEGLKASVKLNGVANETCFINEGIGYRWEGGRSGMDNTPRGKTMLKAVADRPNNPDMLWVDAICQQALSAKMIAKLYDIMNDTANADIWMKRFDEKKRIVNDYYWDFEDGFYYDINCDTKDFYKVMTIGSYWALTAEICDANRAKAMLSRLLDNSFLGGKVPLISLSKSDADYCADGRYWRGGLWLPTAYATLCGLKNYGFLNEARELAEKVFVHMLDTYNEYKPHTIWECYSPECCTPSKDASGKTFVRPDFCGWSALGPISLYVEFVLGFHTVDAFEKIVEWQMPCDVEGEIGIRNLRFGDVVTDILSESGICKVTSNEPYVLKINGKSHQINVGENIICI